jgi:hypothetical protein
MRAFGERFSVKYWQLRGMGGMCFHIYNSPLCKVSMQKYHSENMYTMRNEAGLGQVKHFLPSCGLAAEMKMNARISKAFRPAKH